MVVEIDSVYRCWPQIAWFGGSIEIDMVLVWVVDIDFILVRGIELDLILVLRSGMIWFLSWGQK